MTLHHLLPVSVQAFLKRTYNDYHHRKRQRLAMAGLVRAATQLSASCLNGSYTLEDWKKRKEALKANLAWMLGLAPSRPRTPLHADITGTVKKDQYTIEKLVYQSLPGLYVTANFYLPHERPSPLPCVVYLNGHWPSLDGAKTGYQDRYLWYPANGFALLVIDPLGFGEIHGVHAGMNRLNWWHWLSLGYTPAGVEVWNAMRALDWLETRPEVDASRIGVTGISGGGVMTQYLAALDERVSVAAPSCSTYTIGHQVAQGGVPEQCDCTFYPNVYRMDFPEVLALIAPRPLLILGGRKDPVFPPAGFREAFRRTQRIYGLHQEKGVSEPRIRLVESDEAHTDPPHFLHETRRWMSCWLRVDNGDAITKGQPEPERPETLRCIEKAPASALNYHVHDIWIKRPNHEAPKTREAWARRREELLNVLRSRVFGWFPQAGIPYKTRHLIASGGYAADFANYGEYEFDSDTGSPVKACLLTPKGLKGILSLILCVKRPSDHISFPDIDEYLPFLRTHAIVILTPRFAERPLPGYDHACLERTAALLGCSIAAMQVWDILRAVSWVTHDLGIEVSDIAVYGSGSAGIAGLYAAVMEPAIGHVVLRDPPLSHIEGPAIPTILRYTDIEEVAGVLAPRNLTLLSHRRDGFKLTRSIFDLIGAGASFSYARSLPEAILGRPSEIKNLNSTGALSC